MKLILDAGDGCARVTWPGPQVMRAMTSGGLGKLPGDAITADIKENPEKRLEISNSMPLGRAKDNMVRDGYAPAFSARWLDALLAGGETDATALELVRQMTYKDRGGQAAIDPEALPASRLFRAAWRATEGVITLDQSACRVVFARKILDAKGMALTALGRQVEESMLLGAGDDAFEASVAALKAIDLRAIGHKIAVADSPEALLALWPAELPMPPDVARVVEAGVV